MLEFLSNSIDIGTKQTVMSFEGLGETLLDFVQMSDLMGCLDAH
jgi:hypothetical protein